MRQSACSLIGKIMSHGFFSSSDQQHQLLPSPGLTCPQADFGFPGNEGRHRSVGDNSCVHHSERTGLEESMSLNQQQAVLRAGRKTQSLSPAHGTLYKDPAQMILDKFHEEHRRRESSDQRNRFRYGGRDMLSESHFSGEEGKYPAQAGAGELGGRKESCLWGDKKAGVAGVETEGGDPRESRLRNNGNENTPEESREEESVITGNFSCSDSH